jgi:hypothetical protein
MTVVVTHSTPSDATFSATGATAWDATHTLAGVGTMAEQNANAVAITGGTVNNATIGATTATTGAFTTLTSTGGAVNGTVGATTPAAGTFTTITGQTEVLKGTGTNLLLRSTDLTNASWTQSGVTLTGSQTDAFGGTTASLMNNGATTAFHYITQILTLSAQTYTLSCYAKAGTANYVGLGVFGSTTYGAIFNLSTGAFSANITTAPTSYSITAVTGATGWYRCSITIPAISGSNYSNIYISEDGSSVNYTSTNKNITIASPQLEVGTTANTYIPTTTTAVYGTPTLSFSGVAGLGLESNGSLYVSPAGTGALQAQATTSSTVGGNARGANAVDWQTARSAASQVASVTASTISGGVNNTNTGTYSFVGGGYQNTSSANGAGIVSGSTNTASGQFAFVGAGVINTATGFYGFVGNGFANSTTSNSAVTTQSGTMNATTAVTLSGSNANIKVGQYISGTSIGTDTYVAAISGTALTLSKVASGSSTSTLSFFTPHGIVVGGGNNQATGSYSFIGGGGDAGTAANRNVASGDWSFVGGGRNNTANGNGSVICGGGVYAVLSPSTFPNTASGNANFIGAGISNTASGDIASIVGGQGNVASGSRAFVGAGIANTASGGSAAIMGGNYGITRGIEGNHVFPACNVPIASFQGVSQAALLVLGVQTTDATATVLRCNTSAASTSNQVILPNNSAYYFRGEVVSGVTGGGNTKGWSIEGVIKRGANAGTTALVGTPTVTSLYADAGAATWALTATADTTNGGLAITFTGQLATTIRTVCQIRTTEMTY